jgi:hypothetical protein
MPALAVRARAVAFLSSFFWLGAVWGAENIAAGPSFVCKLVTSQVNQMICASEELSTLDRKLAVDFEATVHQANIDGKQLQAEELQWLRDIRNQCATESCLEEAYLTRDAAILDRSLRAASPAVYEDTRPFPIPTSVLAAARMHVGTSCGAGPGEPLPGTSIIENFHVIVTRGGYIVPAIVDGYPFAFWFAQSGPTTSCTVRDVAYWSIPNDQGIIERQPIHVLGEQDLRCQQPETGE